jgi:hypothetical protein
MTAKGQNPVKEDWRKLRPTNPVKRLQKKLMNPCPKDQVFNV